VISGIDAQPSTSVLHSRWMGAMPAVFSARWFGAISVARPGRYTFTLASDDGSTLSVDGARLIDNSGRHGLEARSATIDLATGSHQVVLEYSQLGGSLALEWSWAREGGSPAAVPSWVLTLGRERPWLVLAARIADTVSLALGTLALLLVPVAAWARGWTPVAYPRAWALALFTVLAILHTWPIASDPGHLTRFDNRDAVLNTWIVAWVARQIVVDPLHLFDGNVFYPERYTVAFSEPLVVQAVMGAPLLWLGASPVLTANLLLIAGFALNGWVMTLVMRRWTGDWTAALVSGSLFAFCGHAFSRIPHLQAQHVEFLPLALYAFDRVLEAPSTRNAARLAVWFVLQSLASIYLMTFTAFALIASLLVRLGDLRRHPLVTLRALVIAGALAGAMLAPFLLPYYILTRDFGFVRAPSAFYAADWSSYLATTARIHRWWSEWFFTGNVLFPGVLALALTAVAIAGGALRQGRARMCLAMGLVGLALSFGTNLPGYVVLYKVMPLLGAIRANARFGYLVTCAAAMLAGFGVVTLRRASAPARWRMAAPALVLMAAFEGTSAPLGLTRVESIPDIYAQVPRTPGTVVVELPFHGTSTSRFHADYMLNSTRHWQPIVNGHSDFRPQSFYDKVRLLQQFPRDPAIERLRAIGVTHVFVNAGAMGEAAVAAADARPELRRVRSFGTIVLYEMRR
jgi:hypothetical protein